MRVVNDFLMCSDGLGGTVDCALACKHSGPGFSPPLSLLVLHSATSPPPSTPSPLCPLLLVLLLLLLLLILLNLLLLLRLLIFLLLFLLLLLLPSFSFCFIHPQTPSITRV